MPIMTGSDLTLLERKNCWEVKQCGHNPDRPGATVGRELCPAATPGRYDGINKGKFAGRFCWAVERTLCAGQVQDQFAQKFIDCLHCDFFKLVDNEEGRFLVLTPYEAENRHQFKFGVVR
ncbi:MAG: hypothetical protein OEV91_06945 [Desulfobulbaceae bacterium]|nr:hypothetical protein [Desulfobulbaceae bacterium]